MMYNHDRVSTNNHAEGYNFCLGNKKRISNHPNFTWSFDPELGTPADWKKKMKNNGCWGDEVFLYLASNVLSSDRVRLQWSSLPVNQAKQL